MKPLVDPKVDFAFKHVFGQEQNKQLLISLLDAVLQPPEGQGIADIELLNPFNDKDALGAKQPVLDIKARDERSRQFNVEMQMLAYGAFRQRALYYWAGLHQRQLGKGKDYRVLRPTIAVCFVDTPLFPDFDGYHSVFELRERGRGALFTDQMAVHILEIPKFAKAADGLTTPLDRWLYFLRHAPALDIDSLPATLDVPEVRLALGDLIMISQSERERERYESHLKQQRDMYTVVAEAEDRGEARGIGIGIEKGIEQGRAGTLMSLIPYLQRLLHHEVISREQLQALPMPELDALAARLQAEIDAQQANGPSA